MSAAKLLPLMLYTILQALFVFKYNNFFPIAMKDTTNLPRSVMSQSVLYIANILCSCMCVCLNIGLLRNLKTFPSASSKKREFCCCIVVCCRGHSLKCMSKIPNDHHHNLLRLGVFHTPSFLFCPCYLILIFSSFILYII